MLLHSPSRLRQIGRVRQPGTLQAALLAACLAVASAVPEEATAGGSPDRVVALGGVVTEIVYALGKGDRLVARDAISTWPAEAEALPDVGYVRALSPEGALSVDPDLILAIEGSGPPETIDVLEAADIRLITVPEGHDAAAIRARIERVAEALGVADAGAALAREVEAALAAAVADAAAPVSPRVLFVLSMQGGRIMATGENTGAEGVIELAGGVHAMTGFEGYKQVSDEAVLLAAPDVILMMDRSGDHAADDAGIRAHSALGQTPADESGAIMRLPGLLMLGFGPRTPEAVRALSRAFAQVRS